MNRSILFIDWYPPVKPTFYDADGEKVRRVLRALGSKARQQYPARQYSGHDALPADCKFPWQPTG
jgi:hypothetical protein